MTIEQASMVERSRVPITWRVVLMGLLACSLVREIDEPFWGLHDFNTADQAQFARALLRFPLEVHRLLPTYALGLQTPAHVHHYAHHPPLITWLTAASLAAFGDSEWAARLPPVLCSLIGMWVFLGLIERANGARIAVLAGAIFAVLPVGAFFGRMTNHEAPTLCFSLVALWGWTRVVQGEIGRLGAAAYVAGLGAAMYSGWPGVIVAFGIALHAVVLGIRSRVRWSAVAMVSVWPFVVIGALLAHLTYGGLDGRWDWLWSILTARATGRDTPAATHTVATLWRLTEQNLTVPVVILAIAGLSLGILRRGWPGKGAASALWILLVAAALHLSFYHQAMVHEYWWFYMWPVAAWLGAIGLDGIAGVLQRLERATAARRERENTESTAAAGRVADIVTAIGLAVCAAAAMVHTNRYFAAVTYPPSEVAFWRELAGRIGPHTPVLMPQELRQAQQHGDYTHWWWGSAAAAYYMDRPYRLATTMEDVAANAHAYSYFVAPIGWLQQDAELRARLNAAYGPAQVLAGYAVYDVRGQR